MEAQRTLETQDSRLKTTDAPNWAKSAQSRASSVSRLLDQSLQSLAAKWSRVSSLETRTVRPQPPHPHSFGPTPRLETPKTQDSGRALGGKRVETSEGPKTRDSGLETRECRIFNAIESTPHTRHYTHRSAPTDTIGYPGRAVPLGGYIPTRPQTGTSSAAGGR